MLNWIEIWQIWRPWQHTTQSLATNSMHCDTFLSWPALSYSGVWARVAFLCGETDGFVFTLYLPQWFLVAHDPDDSLPVVLSYTTFGRYKLLHNGNTPTRFVVLQMLWPCCLAITIWPLSLGSLLRSFCLPICASFSTWNSRTDFSLSA